ncbi:Vegetative incompatibility protein HET-E-1 [Cytospora mali]|uniref:Vegetative incompatibility protein HET-E-1 n=1 Tax=Cytospora mali TaxID=578113 RepID=A0A194VQE6_CYTMA|nr:Vegetative incompatibility protein HET-E-1 [Valsa mali]
MGGLVFKKAFIQGLLNDEFRPIVSMVDAVLFLATPHRGTDLADTLNKFLASSMFGHSAKDYVSELARRSPTINELNESFRHHSSGLKVFSFYETLSTAIGPLSTMIVDKTSSVLGYPGETLQPLYANHHDVCKFKSAQDPNYISVVGALRSVVGSVVLSTASESRFEYDLKQAKVLLGVTGPPEEDLAAARAMRKQGTCQTFISSREFIDWRESQSSHIIWAHANPGNGKSTLCSMIVDHLRDEGKICGYYFFKHDNFQKRRVSSLLKSLAFQTASQQLETCRAFARLADSGSSLQKANVVTIWKDVYLGILAEQRDENDIFWVIDAIDESESARQILELLSDVGDFRPRLHILLLGRPQAPITQAIQKAKGRILVTEVALSDNEADIRTVVANEIEYLQSHDDELKTQIIDEITKRSQGNFLWASLVVEQVTRCRRQEQIRQVLETSPDGMDSLYNRMLDSISNFDIQEDLALARIMLSWAMYARTPLTVEELSGPYAVELKSVMDLKYTLNEVCGGFVVINANNSITLVHHSAKEYLQRHMDQCAPLSLEPTQAHEELFGKCLVAICDKSLRSKLQTLKISPFLQYAATSWAYHLDKCPAHSDRVLNGLTKLFKDHSILSWIQYLAMSGRLPDLPGVARNLMIYAKKSRKIESKRLPETRRTSDITLIEDWAGDLENIAVKFGRNLSEDPSMIFKCVPALSPSSSVISQTFSGNPTTILSVTGTTNKEWDDCIARVSGSSGRALRLACSSMYLAVAPDVPMGDVILWDTTLFQEIRTFSMKERISQLMFNHTGSLFACCGKSRTCVWRVEDGMAVLKVQNPPLEWAIELKFDDHDSLFMVTDIRGVYKLPFEDGGSDEGSWVKLSPQLLEETALPEGVWIGTPTGVTFNKDCSQIAVAYGRVPPAIWNVDPPFVTARLPDRRKYHPGRPPPTSYAGGSKVVWHPSGAYVFGIHGDIFRWALAEDAYDIIQGETDVTPRSIECSPNGLVFMTADVQGLIKIYEVESMALIYKLRSEGGIDHICFSPDSLRFYDLRWSYCNVWAPSCLVRLADASIDRFIDSAMTNYKFWSNMGDAPDTSIQITVPERHASIKPAITAIVAHIKCA